MANCMGLYCWLSTPFLLELVIVDDELPGIRADDSKLKMQRAAGTTIKFGKSFKEA